MTLRFYNLVAMKAKVIATSRGVVTLPVEVYTPARKREFDEAEAELSCVLAEGATPPCRSAKAKAKKR